MSLISVQDRFRKEYAPIDGDQKASVGVIKDLAGQLESAIKDSQEYVVLNAKTPERAAEAHSDFKVALERLKESVMWAVNGTTTTLD